MNVLIRLAAETLHSFEIAFFRNLFGILAMLPGVLGHGLRQTLRTAHFPLHALRGVLNAGAMLTFFYALPITPLATVAALGFTAPLFATLLAVLVLHERVGPRRWVGIACGFGGVLIVLRPGMEGVPPAAWLLVASALLWAGALVVIKLLARSDSSLTITFYASCFLTPITLAFALFDWRWPDPWMLAVLVAIGLLGTATQFLLAQAFHEADASRVLPIDFTKLIWASFFGFWLFDEVPDLATIVGGSVILTAVSYVALREERVRP